MIFERKNFSQYKELMIFIILSTIILLFISLWYIYPLIFKRSFMSAFCEVYLRLTNHHYNYDQTKEQLRQRLSNPEPKYNISPRIKKFYNFKQSELFGLDTFIFEGSKNCCILYLHGGCYVNPPLIFHWSFLSKISKMTKSSIYVPIYPKAPFHHFDESYEILTKFYEHLKSEYKTVIMMGDSSGGGLSLGLCEFFLTENLSLPNELILIAPWVDLTFSNPDVEKAEKTDPRNNTSSLSAMAESWSNGDLNNYKVSPIFGAVKGLRNVTLITGTDDLLYPDTVKLAGILKKEGVKCKLIVADKMNHVYPVYPIPEAKEAINEICSIISSACEIDDQ